MLIPSKSHLFVYVVARDFGFAPNPFHGFCTLATCKPKIRNAAKIGDWIIGVGGSRLKATGRCIFALKVTEIVSFDEYWDDPRFIVKRPRRNGSLAMMIGDNIYHRNAKGEWIQEDSHHSNFDGSTNIENLQRDTGSTNVIISDHFYYFGVSAPEMPFENIGYENKRSHRKIQITEEVELFLSGIEIKFKGSLNTIIGLPFDFDAATKRVDQASSKIA